VSVVELTDGLLPGADRDLVKPLHQRLDKLFAGIHLRTKVTKIEEVAAPAGGAIRVHFEGPEGASTREFSRVLVAVGRRPNSDGIGLELTGVTIDKRGFVEVDDRQRTSDPRILAIGDVCGEPMLAHRASHQGKVAVEGLHGEPAAFAPRAIPAVVFTDPEIAWAGLTEQEAAATGRTVEISRYPWAASGRAQALGRTDGLTKLVVDPESERVLGVGIVGAGAGELVAEGALAIEMGCTARDLAETIHPHPTLGETVAFSAEVEPALYLAGKVGTATAPGATLVKFGGGGVTGGGDPGPDPDPDPDPGTVPAPGTEMLTNGNFDQFADQRYGDGVSWGGYGSVAGWQSNSDALGAGQPNAIEIHQMNQSDPLYRNAIETDIGVGNSAGPDVTWQDVQTQAGRSYDLSFDYLAVGQAILSGGNSAGFEVLWNGQVVATISPTDSQWRTVNLSVTGTGGQDRLAFREMGTDDTHGSFINNVSLKAGAAVSAPAGPNLVENGSFEADNVAAGASRVVNAPQRWSSPNSGANEVIDTLGGIAGDDGAQYMELGAASVSQTLTTQAGQNYLLSFAYRDGDTGNPPEHFFDVLVNGQVKGRIDANGINQWTDQAFTFTGTGSDTITFQRVSGGAGTGVRLDNVNVQALGTSAPAYGADIVQNGSFEADNIASNSFQFLNVTGWTGRTASNGELQDGLVAGSEGAQYLELMNGGTKQSLATVAGKIYQLDFMSRYGNDGTAQSNAFQVYFGGQLVGTVNPQQG